MMDLLPGPCPCPWEPLCSPRAQSFSAILKIRIPPLTWLWVLFPLSPDRVLLLLLGFHPTHLPKKGEVLVPRVQVLLPVPDIQDPTWHWREGKSGAVGMAGL